MVQNQYAPQFNPYAQQVPGFPPQQQGGFPGGQSPYGGGFPPQQMPPDAFGPGGMGAPTGPGQGVYQHESGGFADTNDLKDESEGILSKISNFALSWKGLATIIVGGLAIGFGPSLWKSAFGKGKDAAKKAVTDLEKTVQDKAKDSFAKFHGHAAPETESTPHRFMKELENKSTKEELENYKKEIDTAFSELTGLQDAPQGAVDGFKKARHDAIATKIKALDGKKENQPSEDAVKKLHTDLFAADKAYQEHVVTPLTPKSD